MADGREEREEERKRREQEERKDREDRLDRGRREEGNRSAADRNGGPGGHSYSRSGDRRYSLQSHAIIGPQ